jgi:copper homeostasis protein
MQNSLVLEVCVESIDHAVAAERGGAHRIELCSDLASGGITPSAGLIEASRHHLRLPIHLLIRPRAGDFLYSDYEFEIMERDIHIAKHLRMDGIVLGLLDENERVDVPRTRTLVDLARPLPVTFHRAFDECQDRDACLEAVIQTGAARILTSAGQARARDGITALAHLVRAARDRIVVMPGGGVDVDNVQLILRQTAAREIHTSLGLSAAATNHASRLSGVAGGDSSEFEGRVRKVSEMLEAISLDLVHEADLTS